MFCWTTTHAEQKVVRLGIFGSTIGKQPSECVFTPIERSWKAWNVERSTIGLAAKRLSNGKDS